MTITGISASLLQHCTYTGANSTRRIRDSRIYASANDTVNFTKHSKSNRSPRFVDFAWRLLVNRYMLPSLCSASLAKRAPDGAVGRGALVSGRLQPHGGTNTVRYVELLSPLLYQKR